jgi:hypothetical protein
MTLACPVRSPGNAAPSELQTITRAAIGGMHKMARRPMNFIPGCRYSARPGFLDEVVQRFIDLREKALDSHHLTTSVSCKQPDGQITSTSPDLCLSIPSRKNIPLSPSGKSVVLICASHPMRGALRNVTNARWDAVDAALAKTNARRSRTAKSCGPGAPVLALSFTRSKLLRNDGGNKPVTGESEVSRKPSRRESRVDSG